MFSFAFLQDILENDDLKLDDMFIASLIFDLIRVSTLHIFPFFTPRFSCWLILTFVILPMYLAITRYSRHIDNTATLFGAVHLGFLHRGEIHIFPEITERDRTPPVSTSKRIHIFLFSLFQAETD